MECLAIRDAVFKSIKDLNKEIHERVERPTALPKSGSSQLVWGGQPTAVRENQKPAILLVCEPP